MLLAGSSGLVSGVRERSSNGIRWAQRTVNRGVTGTTLQNELGYLRGVRGSADLVVGLRPS